MKRRAGLFSLLISSVAFASSGSKPEPDRVWITDMVIISPENLDHEEKRSVLIAKDEKERDAAGFSDVA